MWKNLSSLILTYNVSIEVGYKTEQRPQFQKNHP
jgi:hypothetical protein